MKKWKVTFTVTNHLHEVRLTEIKIYKKEYYARTAIARQIYKMFTIGVDSFEVRRWPGEINVVRHVFKGPDIRYKWTLEEL